MRLHRRIAAWFAAPFRSESEALGAPVAVEPQTLAAPVVRHAAFAPKRVPPDRMAAELLAWLQGDDGRVGCIPAHELMAIWREFCLDRGYADVNWRMCAHTLRNLIGDPKQQFGQREDGRRQVVYHIPPLDSDDEAGAPEADVIPLRKKAA
jgi:hypothetical protein